MGAAVLKLNMDHGLSQICPLLGLKWGSFPPYTNRSQWVCRLFAATHHRHCANQKLRVFPVPSASTQLPVWFGDQCSAYITSENQIQFLDQATKSIFYTSCANLQKETIPVPNSCKLADISPAPNFYHHLRAFYQPRRFSHSPLCRFWL